MLCYVKTDPNLTMQSVRPVLVISDLSEEWNGK